MIIGITVAALFGFGCGWIFGEESGFKLGVMRGIDEYCRLLKENPQTRNAE